MRFPDAVIWRLPAGLHGFKRKTLVIVRAHLVTLRRDLYLVRRAARREGWRLSGALPQLSEEPAVTRLGNEIQASKLSITIIRLIVEMSNGYDGY